MIRLIAATLLFWLAQPALAREEFLDALGRGEAELSGKLKAFKPAGLPKAAAAAPSRTQAVAACIRSPSCRATFIVAHRGDGFGAPENSRATLQRAIDAGIPVIETDVRRSRDGILYILHDAAIDRTTNSRGRISELTAAHLSRVRLSNGETLPRFAEFYAIARGRAILNLDMKDDAIEEIADWLAANGSFDDVIFFAYTPEKLKSAMRAKARHPRMIVMSRAHGYFLSAADIERKLGVLTEIVHTDYPVGGLVADLHARGVKVFANLLVQERVGLADAAARKLYAQQTDFMQTDSPLWLWHVLSQEGFVLERTGP